MRGKPAGPVALPSEGSVIGVKEGRPPLVRDGIIRIRGIIENLHRMPLITALRCSLMRGVSFIIEIMGWSGIVERDKDCYREERNGIQQWPNIVWIIVPFHPETGKERGKATCTVYRNFWRYAFSTKNERGWVNEEVEEGLRDYRREQSAKKCASTYSLLGRTHISLAVKGWCPPLCICFFLIHLRMLYFMSALVPICYILFGRNVCEICTACNLFSKFPDVYKEHIICERFI